MQSFSNKYKLHREGHPLDELAGLTMEYLME